MSDLGKRINEYLEWLHSHHAANQIIIELMGMLDYADDTLKDVLGHYPKLNTRYHLTSAEPTPNKE